MFFFGSSNIFLSIGNWFCGHKPCKCPLQITLLMVHIERNSSNSSISPLFTRVILLHNSCELSYDMYITPITIKQQSPQAFIMEHMNSALFLSISRKKTRITTDHLRLWALWLSHWATGALIIGCLMVTVAMQTSINAHMSYVTELLLWIMVIYWNLMSFLRLNHKKSSLERAFSWFMPHQINFL